MARRALSDAEREQRAERVAQLAAAAVIIEEGRPADIDTAVAILGKYSRRNVALILAQAEERGQEWPQGVAGFHDWRKAGRQVVKGAKGYLIYAPVMRKGHDDEETRTRYTVRYVFDVRDTESLGTNEGVTE